MGPTSRIGLTDEGCGVRALSEEYDHSPDWTMENDSPGVDKRPMTVRVDEPKIISKRVGSRGGDTDI